MKIAPDTYRLRVGLVSCRRFAHPPRTSRLSNPPSFQFNSTDSMSSLLRHQTRSAFVQNHMRLLRRFTHRSIATKDSNTVTKYVPFLKRSLVLRPFHSSRISHSSCDFSSPCTCPECRQAARKPICEICRVHPTVHQSSEYEVDRKGVGGYSFTSLCEQCRNVKERAEREKRRRSRFRPGTRREWLACQTMCSKFT